MLLLHGTLEYQKPQTQQQNAHNIKAKKNPSSQEELSLWVCARNIMMIVNDDDDQ